MAVEMTRATLASSRSHRSGYDCRMRRDSVNAGGFFGRGGRAGSSSGRARPAPSPMSTAADMARTWPDIVWSTTTRTGRSAIRDGGPTTSHRHSSGSRSTPTPQPPPPNADRNENSCRRGPDGRNGTRCSCGNCAAVRRCVQLLPLPSPATYVPTLGDLDRHGRSTCFGFRQERSVPGHNADVRSSIFRSVVYGRARSGAQSGRPTSCCPVRPMIVRCALFLRARSRRKRARYSSRALLCRRHTSCIGWRAEFDTMGRTRRFAQTSSRAPGRGSWWGLASFVANAHTGTAGC